ncbi:PREDICTED: ethylene receptor 2 [Tarenaya hassleriana]|uniref:ethylene receptor 2 n=1 Tax=Tarenaya hassleriana TaxID=28532 RepID=UPI00053C0A5E|nr:PREDICTED: ethylene receptor 2 [Tarenaya hassleriana]
MSRQASSVLFLFLVTSSLLLLVSPVAGNGFQRCNCDDEGSFWSIENILETQRVSDFLIAVAYFSIPIELLYFVSCSNVPFKWVLFEFIAFIVLCGLTHLLHGWTYGPHTFRLMLALTVFKILTALVSCATAITLITLIPMLLKVKVREFMLKKKARELGREVGIIMKQKETSLHVRMLTQEIRKSLDRHTILYTTLVELSKTLGLQNCAVWMPNDVKTEMNLTHELKGRGSYSDGYGCSVSINDPDVRSIKESEEVNILSSDSLLARASSGESGEIGPLAAIRMPMLRVSNFKGGTPELIQTCYAILVCVLPSGQPRDWTNQELEIVKVVADQVAVALSHAAILEESQLMREKLAEQNRALQLARQNAMRANHARNAFQKVMSDGMRRPMHSVLGLLSMLQAENLSEEQKMIVDTAMKTGNVLSNLVNDVMDLSRKAQSGRFKTEMKPFSLHRMTREAACLAKCLCLYNGLGFVIEAEKSLPDNIIGDERRVFQVIFHMVGSLLKCRRYRAGAASSLIFRVLSERGSDHRWAAWKQPSSSDEDVHIRFDMRIENIPNSLSDLSVSSSTHELEDSRFSSDIFGQDLSFCICQKLVQMMQGNISVVPSHEGSSMSLLLRFRTRPSISTVVTETAEVTALSNSQFRGVQVLLADTDDSNRAVTRKLLEKLGCVVTAVGSGFECLTAIGVANSEFQVVVLDLQMREMDGYDVATRIRKFRSRSWPLIVAVTANSDEDMWEKCMQVGINGVVRKPVVLRAIWFELRRVLSQADKDL